MKRLLTIFLFIGITTFSNATEIKMMTENYPPYNMEVDGKLEGISVEILDAMLKDMGSSKNRYDIELLSWSKAYTKAQNEKNNMVFSTTRTKARENLFKWVGPIAKTTVGILALKNKRIKINNLSELSNYKIGAIKKDIGELLLLENKVAKNSIDSVDGVNSLATSFYKLERGKIDLFACDVDVGKYSSDLNGFDSSDYEVVYTLQNSELYFAFNRLTSDEIIKKWQKSLDNIKANGTYQKIINK